MPAAALLLVAYLEVLVQRGALALGHRDAKLDAVGVTLGLGGDEHRYTLPAQGAEDEAVKDGVDLGVCRSWRLRGVERQPLVDGGCRCVAGTEGGLRLSHRAAS